MTGQAGVAILDFHDGAAGQIAEWFSAATGLQIGAFVEVTGAHVPVDPAAENARRASQRTEFPSGGLFKGKPFFSDADWPARIRALGIRRVLPLVPDNVERLRAIRRCAAEGLELVSAVHPSVLVLEQALLEPGVWINAGTIVGYKAEVRAGALLNTAVRIDHHSIVETCAQLDPGVVTAGNATIRRCAHVHTAAVLRNRVEVGEGAIVGAGAVVIADVPAWSTVVGVPARVIRTRAAAF
jgi:acetyltransferase-like isoleucine patch superfamily enzyme